jgi:DNA repair protein RAD5
MQTEDGEEPSPADSQDADISVNNIIKQWAEREENGGTGNESYAQKVLNNLETSGAEECPICMDIMEEPMLLPACAHFWYVVASDSS